MRKWSLCIWRLGFDQKLVILNSTLKRMVLHIFLDGNDIKLIIKDGDKIIGEISWHGEHSLSEQLLGKIDELLRENGLKKEEIEKVETQVSETTGITSRRIVETIAEAWNVGRELTKKNV